jgi:hypothetical protein
MVLFSVVPSNFPGSKKAEEKVTDFLPCGHTQKQASWLGCANGVCRSVDEAITKDYRAWVAAGRPEFGKGR